MLRLKLERRHIPAQQQETRPEGRREENALQSSAPELQQERKEKKVCSVKRSLFSISKSSTFCKL